MSLFMGGELHQKFPVTSEQMLSFYSCAVQERFEAYVLDMFKGSTVGKLLEKPADVKVKKSPDNA